MMIGSEVSTPVVSATDRLIVSDLIVSLPLAGFFFLALAAIARSCFFFFLVFFLVLRPPAPFSIALVTVIPPAFSEKATFGAPLLSVIISLLPVIRSV